MIYKTVIYIELFAYLIEKQDIYIQSRYLKTYKKRLPQNTTNVNIENTRKSKQLYYLYDQFLGALIYLNFIFLILICFELIMPDVNYAVSGCSS